MTRSRKKSKLRYKPRFFLIIGVFICLILLGFQFLVFAQVRENRDILEVSLSQDLNVNQGESLFELVLEWPGLDEETFKSIQIKVNDNEVELPLSATKFETEITDPDTEFTIEFRAERKGFGFDKRDSITVRTLGDNEVIEQSISNLEMQSNSISFEHTLTHLPSPFDLSSVTYELTDFWQQKSMTLEPILLEKSNGVGTFQVTVPLNDFLESPSLSLSLRANNGDTSFFAYVTDTFESQIQNYDMTDGAFTLYIENGQFVLLNDKIESLTYSTHNFFAESLHLELKEEVEIKTYQLVNMEGETVVDHEYLPLANQAIDLSTLEEGSYFVLLNEKMVHVDQEVHDVWYTVTRNGYAGKVTVHNLSGVLAIRVEKVSELPADVYDILVDPGHGGLDGGATGHGLIEAEEVLKISEFIADRLEDHGLKVRMSRTGDYEPSGDETFDWMRSPYFENGRVSQVYQYRTNFVISNHKNANNGDIEGLEVYSSIFTTDTWSSLVASHIMDTGRSASTKRLGKVSEGSYNRTLSCQRLRIYDQLFGCTVPELDAFFMIRETGGQMTFASEMVHFNPEFHPEVPNFGAEAILIEYAYIDNANDARRWKEEWKVWGEAVVKATLEYLGIEYRPKR